MLIVQRVFACINSCKNILSSGKIRPGRMFIHDDSTVAAATFLLVARFGLVARVGLVVAAECYG